MRKLLVVMVTSILFTACENRDEMVDITDQCEFPEHFISNCFYNVSNYGVDEIIIKDSTTYLMFQDSSRAQIYNINCDTASLMQIDFNSQWLLGKVVMGGGCFINTNRSIINDKQNRKIIYEIQAKCEGSCEMLITSWNWALIPKMPNDYMVEFDMIVNE